LEYIEEFHLKINVNDQILNQISNFIDEMKSYNSHISYVTAKFSCEFIVQIHPKLTSFKDTQLNEWLIIEFQKE